MSKVGGSYSYNAICDVCGFQFKSHEMRKRWDGLMVCPADWEMRHPLDFYKTRDDTHKLPFIRTEPGQPDYTLGIGDYDYNVEDFSTTAGTFGNTFTTTGLSYNGGVNPDSFYIEAIKFYQLGRGAGNVGPFWVSLWSKTGAFGSYGLAWSKMVHVPASSEGWTVIPVTPNQKFTLQEDATTYFVGVTVPQNFPLVGYSPEPSIPNTDLFNYGIGVYITHTDLVPTAPAYELSSTLFLDVIGRPGQ